MSTRDELMSHILEHSLRTGDFTLASGKKSAYYFNGKNTTLESRGAYLTARVFLAMIGDDVPDAIGGLTLGADPIVGSMLTLAGMEDLQLNGFIVRKKAKDHGTKSLIEGPVKEGDKVVIIEDVVTTGGSSMEAIDALKSLGCDIRKVLAIVDREEGGRANLLEAGYRLESIFTARELLAAAKSTSD